MEMLFAAIGFTYSFSIADFEMFEKRSTIPVEESLSGGKFRASERLLLVDPSFQSITRRVEDPSSDDISEIAMDTSTNSSQTPDVNDIQSTLLDAEQKVGGMYDLPFAS